MNDRQINCFLQVVENQSFTKAAELLFMAQPAVSRQIAELEKEIGFSLFYRTKGKRAQLTKIGQLYWDYFSKQKIEFSLLNAYAHELSGSLSGNLKLGILSGWNVSSFLPNVLKEFEKLYPGVKVHVMFKEFVSLMDSLDNGALDLIIALEQTIKKSPDVQAQHLTSIERILLYSPEHPVAKAKDHPVPEDFRDSTFLVALNHDGKSPQFVKDFCAPYNFVPNVEVVTGVDALIAGVQNLMGVAFVDDWSREKQNSAFRYIPLSSHNHVHIAWRVQNENPVLQLFISELTRYVNSYTVFP